MSVRSGMKGRSRAIKYENRKNKGSQVSWPVIPAVIKVPGSDILDLIFSLRESTIEAEFSFWLFLVLVKLT